MTPDEANLLIGTLVRKITIIRASDKPDVDKRHAIERVESEIQAIKAEHFPNGRRITGQVG